TSGFQRRLAHPTASASRAYNSSPQPVFQLETVGRTEIRAVAKPQKGPSPIATAIAKQLPISRCAPPKISILGRFKPNPIAPAARQRSDRRENPGRSNAGIYLQMWFLVL